MGDSISILPSVATIPSVDAFASELGELLARALERKWVREVFGQAPSSELQPVIRWCHFHQGVVTVRRADPAEPFGGNADGYWWIEVDKNSGFPLYFDEESDRHAELVQLVLEDARGRADAPAALLAFPYGRAREAGWSWGTATRASPRGAMRVLGTLSAVALGTLTEAVLWSGDHGLEPALDPSLPNEYSVRYLR